MKYFMSLVVTMLAFASHGFASEVNMAATNFSWKASKKVGSFHHGPISLKSAKVMMKENKLVSGEFVMDMKSFDVTDLEGEWKEKFLAHVKSGDFFLVDKFPTAKLVLDKQTSATAVSGKLTIKDQTHPIKIDFTQEGKVYKGTMKFDRTKYGVTYGSENFFKNLVADKIINNEVEVNFTVTLK